MGPRELRPGEHRRAALDRLVALRFKHSEEFVEELAVNVSAGGMFIRTRRPHPVGSVFEFQLRLGGDRPLIAGKAQVAWVRRRDETAETPAGMGVRFVELDNESRRHLAELAAASGTRRGRTDDADPPRTAAPTAGGPEGTERMPAAAVNDEAAASAVRAAAWREAAMPPGGRAESAARRRPVGQLPAVLMALVVAAALAAALWWPPSVADPPVDATATAAAPSPIVAQEVATASDGGTATATGPAAAAAARPAQLRLVDEWARAWSAQRVDDYLDAYSARFTPEGGLDRAGWERQRRGRILAPQRIEVSLALIELEELDADTSRVRFVQAYESDSYRDVVRKVLELDREPGGWKIVRESVEE